MRRRRCELVRSAAASRRGSRRGAAPPCRPCSRRRGYGRSARGSRCRRVRARARRRSGGTHPTGARSDDEPDLHEQHAAVAARPQVAQVRQADDREVHAGAEHERDQHRREPREAHERRAAKLRRAGPEQRAPSSRAPPIQSDAAERCTQSAISVFHDEPGSTASCPETREPAGEHDRERERRHERLDAVEQPREVDEREHEREDRASSSRTRRRTASSPSARDRRRGTARTAAAARPPRAARTRAIPAWIVRDGAEAAGDRDPPLETPRHRQGRAGTIRRKPERADRQREPEEPDPANDVLRRRRAARAVGVLDGGAGTRTPNVHTPETTCESAEIACQRTVYAPSFRSCRTGATTSVPSARAGRRSSCRRRSGRGSSPGAPSPAGRTRAGSPTAPA